MSMCMQIPDKSCVDQSSMAAGVSQPGLYPNPRGSATPSQATGLPRKELNRPTSFSQRPAIPSVCVDPGEQLCGPEL
ncbi:hypothetical protein H920_07196 [Fukomys damarensis]|uniref:Uncharacterized protein n=1 Tax=Fukomys damarensis TaxID=885580 RepID=A0A091E887_FUKDA|nr:hypothetical protein H920_07196 [Fukomys damarensis]